MPNFDSGSRVIPSSISTDYRVAAFQANLVNGQHWKWADTNLTFSFPKAGSLFKNGTHYGKGEVSAGWTPFSEAQKVAVRQALATWSAVSLVTFTEVEDGATVGDLRFGFSNAVSGNIKGWAYGPGADAALAGDVWLNGRLANADFNFSPDRQGGWYAIDFQTQSYQATQRENFLTLLHEIGHALGLSHPFLEDGGRGTPPLPPAEDNETTTLMTYRSDYASGYYNTGNVGASAIPEGPMMYDILAVQHLYGGNYSTTVPREQGDYYRFDVNEINFTTIWDGHGRQTIVANNFRGQFEPHDPMSRVHGWAHIDLRQGQGSMIGWASEAANASDLQNQTARSPSRVMTPNIFIAYGTDIENAIGTDSQYKGDTLIGNELNNELTGRDGSDFIDGQGGVDTAFYYGPRANYSIARVVTSNFDGWEVTDLARFPNLPPPFPSRYVDRVTNVEWLGFGDGFVNLNPQLTPAQLVLQPTPPRGITGTWMYADRYVVTEGENIVIHYGSDQPAGTYATIMTGVNSEDFAFPYDVAGGALVMTRRLWDHLGRDQQDTLTPIRDNVNEGFETLTYRIGDVSISVVIKDGPRTKGPTSKDQVFVFKSEKVGAGIGPASHSYFYTSSADEAANVRSQSTWPWVEKRSTFEAAHSNPDNATPVFRFWSDKHQSHFFTISEAEKAEIISRSATGANGYDWRFEGNGFPVYATGAFTDEANLPAVPVYRMWIQDKDFNPANGYSGGHYFTADRAEYDQMIRLAGVGGEGVAFYGEPLG